MLITILIFLAILLLVPIGWERLYYEISHRKRIVSVHINQKTASSFAIGEQGYRDLELLVDNRNTQLLTLYIDANGLSMTHHQALRMVLVRIRNTGKQVWVYLYDRDRASYYLASVADKIYMLPTGSIFWMGLGGHHPFYKKLLDFVGIKADFERAGSYKSFAEPYTKEGPSDEYKEQYISLLSSLQEQLLEDVSSSRSIEREVLEEAFLSSPMTAERAKEFGMIDELGFEDQFTEAAEEFTKSKEISLHRLAWWARWAKKLNFYAKKPPTIAVLCLHGAIYEQGNTGNRIIMQDTMEKLQSLREDDDIKAVVLCVNSPGGSAQASECIHREVERLNREKPVVAFFASVAASGGYYLSAAAGEIVALPSTITGSIGVVGGKVVVADIAKKMGVHLEGISVGGDYDLFSPTVPFSPEQRARFQSFLMHTYQRFLQVVSAGRGMPLSSVEACAKGRVYTGLQAQEEGLVDRLGDVNLAIKRAGLRANLKNYRSIYIFPKVGIVQKIRAQFGLSQSKHGLSGLYSLPTDIQLLQAHPIQPLLYSPIASAWEENGQKP